MASNIFDTRNIIKQTPKIGNRFLLAADSTQLNNIINGRSASGTGTSAVSAIPESKIKKLSGLTGGDATVFGTADSQGSVGQSPYDVLNLSLLSATIPAFEFEAAELNRFNDTVKHITKFSTANDMNATYYDYINGSATSIMLAWQSKVGFKLTGEIGYKSQYVCDMNLYVYGPNRPGYRVNNNGNDDVDQEQYELLMQFKIFNAYPRSVDIGDFSYDNTEIKKVIVQFGYDMIVPYKNKKRTGVRNYNTGYDANLQVKNMVDVNSATVTGSDILAANDKVYDIYVNNKYPTS
jgi:hypothetical protein